MAHHPIENANTSPNEHFADVLAKASMSRRSLIRGGVGLFAVGSLPMLAACGGGDDVVEKKLSFSAVGKSIADSVVLPAGYTFSVLHATGDRLVSSIPAFSNQGIETDDWSQRVGDHHDGVEFFYIGSNGKYSTTDTGRAVLAMNHESSADAHFMHPKGQTSNGVNGKKFSQFGDWDLGTRPADGLEALKEINHHGVSLVEVGKNSAGKWEYKVDSAYNRRVNAQTPVRITAPAAHLAAVKSFMVTAFDTTGSTSRGTLNNCGTGYTPWGTLLTCEENWAAYFTCPKAPLQWMPN
jgi:secreted PhoX family phosphatase